MGCASSTNCGLVVVTLSSALARLARTLCDQKSLYLIVYEV